MSEVNKAVGRLKNSRVFSLNRFCKLRSARVIVSREARGPHTCVAREETRISLSRLSLVSLAVFTLTPGLSFDVSRARS